VRSAHLPQELETVLPWQADVTQNEFMGLAPQDLQGALGIGRLGHGQAFLVEDSPQDAEHDWLVVDD
jgi:hypothetical protein